MNITLARRLEKLEQRPAARPAPECTLTLTFNSEEERAAAEAKHLKYPPGGSSLRLVFRRADHKEPHNDL